MLKTKIISPALLFIAFNAFATLLTITFGVKDKTKNSVVTPLTYEQSYRNWFNNFSSQEENQHTSPSQINNDIDFEKQLKDAGLVNVKDIDNSIFVNLKYSTTDNFLLRDIYGNLNDCYLQKEVAEKLSAAQKILHKKYSFYNLVIFDGVRPFSIQKIMWESLKIPVEEKLKYLASPWEKSLHNFGVAVDVSIVNSNGWEMDMGAPYDYFGELGCSISENKMLQEGKLTHRQLENRKLLRNVMTQAGFKLIATEWWHFNFCSRAEAAERYKLIE